MSRIRIALLTLAGLMAVGTQAQAASDTPLTREQVRADYLQARAQGSLSPTGEVGYVAQVNKAKSSVTRTEVLRDLAANGVQDTAEGSDLGNNRAAIRATLNKLPESAPPHGLIEACAN